MSITGHKTIILHPARPVQPAATVARAQHQVSEMFHHLGQGFGRSDWHLPSQPMWAPALRLFEYDRTLVAECDVPSIGDDDLRVTVTPNTLTIEAGGLRGESHRAPVEVVEVESGSFRRRVPLPNRVRPEDVHAAIENGVVRITMPMV